ncbi:SRPBCC domain-containing protein [Leifsonia shinshuensis]|uniref:SRPBCC domain-containing protein n=1 Tax=Leifsonia shinshuensis TaxID=150026 RepID=UPI001F50AED6|nr:SRPBCC domain-containing protein [Leifsonia shinshuensis]MCI0159401.1 SRPBCC domain-containing protein [Leifsonia shinshuensis]
MFFRDDLVEVSAEAVLAAPAAWVFDGLVRPTALSRWFAERAEVELRQGGAVRIERGGAGATGRILDVALGRRLLIGWDAVQESSLVYPGSDLEFFVSASQAGSNLRAVLWKIPANDAAAFGSELTEQLQRLTSFAARTGRPGA